jgi:ferredoxin
MAHRLTASGYARLTQRAQRFPPGVVASELLHRIFAELFSEEDAALLAVLPLRPFTVAQAARVWKVALSDARRRLEAFAARGLLLDGTHRGRRLFVLPPPMAGFFEFCMMRVRPDLDQHALAELLHAYVVEEDDFVTMLFSGPTQLGRALVHQAALPGHDGDDRLRGQRPLGRGVAEGGVAAHADRPPERGGGSAGGVPPPDGLQVLDHELASEIVQGARHRAVGLCYCRHRMAHLGRACGVPQEMCLSLDFAAESLARYGHARAIDAAEAQEIIDQAWDLGLVQFAENVRTSPKFICNCCSCCCDALMAARRLAILHPVVSSGFLPVVDPRRCTGCASCVASCPVLSLSLAPVGVAQAGPARQAGPRDHRLGSAGSGNQHGEPGEPSAAGPTRGKTPAAVAVVDPQTCLGCGLCVRACASHAISLARRPERVLTPVNTAHRVVLQALERGSLPELIFDQPASPSHRALAAILGVLLRLPPMKQALASRQLRSTYLELLLDRPRTSF